MKPTFRPLIASLFCLGLLGLAPASRAESPPPKPPICKDTPEACAERRAEREKQCAANPEHCQHAKEAMTKHREACAADPAQCAERRAQHEKHRAEMKAKCDAQPEACAKRRAEMAERRKAHQAQCETDPKTCAERQARRAERRAACAAHPENCKSHVKESPPPAKQV